MADTKKIYEQFKEAGKLMTSYGFKVSEPVMFLEVGSKVYATKRGADMSDLNEGDIEVIEYQQLPLYDTEYVAMIFFKTSYLMKALSIGRGFTASIDDMAQIIGYMFPVVDVRGTDPFLSDDIARLTKKSTAAAMLTGYDKETETFDGYYMTSGRDLKEAVIGMEVLEKAAKVTFLADKLELAKSINPFDAKVIHKRYVKNYSQTRLEGFTHPTLNDCKEDEMKLRTELVEYGRKLVEKGLVYGTWGNLSVRLDDEYMLTTPSGLDYMDLLPEDMVKVKIDSLDYEGLTPTSEKILHANIYKARPDVRAVVHTHSTYCSVFAAAELNLPTKEDKDKKKYGEVFLYAPYGISGTKNLAHFVVDNLKDNKGVIMAHHGMVAVGSSMKDAFGTACFMEKNAKAILDEIPEKDYGKV